MKHMIGFEVVIVSIVIQTLYKIDQYTSFSA